MGLKIYDRDGGLRIEVQPSDSSSQTAELQGDDVLSMSFSHYGYVGLEVDDYVDFEGVRYRMTERYRPKQKSAMEWEYSIKLYGPESLLRDVLVIKNFEGEHEAEFTLTAPPGEHVALVVSALNGGSGGEWKRGTVTGTENITIDYFGKYCDEALREIAEKAGTEYWTDGTTVNVCRCEHGEPLTLGLADGLTRIEPATAGNVKFYTRLFPMGSTRNIDAESYGHRRLQLPDGAKYVEINADRYRRKDHYEEAAFADIYPRYTGTVSSVRSETRKVTDGEDFTVYYFKDDALPFDPDDYLMAGKVMRISFQEGSDLGGLGDEENGTYYFEANWHADTGEFELITIWPYKDSATQLPGGVLVPKVGDKYIPWNIRMPQEYYTLAEAEFAAAVQKYNADHDVDLTVFKAQTDHVWVEDNAADLFVGRRVRLVSDRYFPETGYRDSRITKISRKINLPTQMEVEIGDALGRSSKTKITDDIRDARDYARSIGNSVSLPDIIRTGDTTRPTDNNLMSALRIIKDFLCKYKDDRTAHKLASDKAFEVGEFLAGISGGFFGIDQNGDSYLEVARLYARVRAVFEELTVIKTGVLAGKQYITPGGGIVCTKVEEVTNASGTLTGWRCYFLSEQDGEKTECKFVANDQAISALFNAAPGTANKVSNHRYWRLVTAVDNDAYTDDSGNHYGYIELSATDCEAGSDTPQAGDEICQFGYRGTDEPRRQTAMVFSTVDADAPSIKLFRGINSYTLEGKAVVQFGVDAQTGKVFFRLGASNATHYLDYTEAGGLQVAGKISTFSTLDDTNTTLGTAINSKVEDTDVLWRVHTSQTDAPVLPVLGADGTIADFKGWQTDAPAVVSGQFVWTTTYVRYGNGTAKFDGTACVTGRDGKDGKDGVTMTSEVVEYAIGTSGTVAPTSGWSTTIPAVPKGQYQWTRVTTTYSDGTPTVSYLVAYIPKDGEDGENGANYTQNLLLNSAFLQGLDKWTGWSTPPVREVVDINGKKWLHVKTNTGNFQGVFQKVATSGQSGVYTFSALVRGAAAGQQFSIGIHFINSSGQIGGQAWNHWTVGTDTQHVSWQCTIPAYAVELSVMVGRADAILSEIYYTDLKLEVGANPNPVWSPAPSEQLGVTIASESVTYAKNTTGIQPPDASFTATAIGQLGTISGGDYIWSKTEVTYTDGTVLKSYAVSRIGSDGETQIAGLHIAYATGITGSLPHPTAVTGFSTTMTAGVVYKYIGIRKDNSTADSTNFADYDWAEFRGSDGQNGASYSNNMLVGTKDWSGDWVYISNGTITTDTYMGCVIFRTSARWGQTGQNIELQPGTYTFSVWVKSDVSGLNLNVYLTEAQWKRVRSTTEWQRVSLTFTLTAAGTYRPRLEKQDAGNDVFYMAGYKLEEGDNRTPTWSPHPSEMVATPAKLVTLNADSLVFTYQDDFATLVGASSINLTASVQGITNPTYEWSCKRDGETAFTPVTPNPGLSPGVFNVGHNGSTIGSAKSVTVRCTVDGVYDEVTIYKVSSGSNGVDGGDGYTVILTNESHVFEGDTEKAVAGSTGCGVIAYKGATQVVAHIGTIKGLAIGMSATIYNNDTTTTAFTVYVNPSLTQRQGTLTIPVTVEGKTFTKIFSWSVSLEGTPGKDARRIAVKSDGYGGSITGGYGYVKVDGTNVRTSASSSSRKRGLTIVTLNRSTLAKVEETYYDLYSGNSAVATARTNFINYINGLSSDVFACITFCDNITWTTEMVTAMKLLGSLGDIRTDGQNRTFAFIGYKGLTPGYALQAQGENAKTPLAEVSAYVADGMFTTAKTQVGTKKLTEEYALSSSETVAPTSGWSETKQPWEAGKFYWTRIKIEYTDGTIEYTTPICATGTPGKDALRLDLTNEMAGVICNSAGTVTGAYPTSQASVYKGSTKLTNGVSYSATPKTGITTVNISDEGDITMSGMTADKAEITVQAVVDGTTLTTTMTLYKVKPGTDGQPATVYQIEPSTNVIKRDMAGTPHPTTLTVTKYRTTGTATRQTTNEYFLYAWQTDANGIYVMSPVVVAGTSAATATIQIAPTAVEVGLELRVSTANGAPVLDRETVPVITDSSGTGIDPRNLALSSGNWNIPAGELSWPNPLEPDWARLNNGCVTRITTDGKLQLYKDSGSDRNGLTEAVSVKNIPSGTVLTLHVKGNVSGLTSGYVDWMLYRTSDWGHSTLFKKITDNGDFDFSATITLGAAYDVAHICHRVAQANSGTTLTIEYVGLYNGVILPSQWAPAPEDGNYLLRAIQKAKQDSTVIDGGLILATLLQLGVTDVSGVRKIMAGLNGNGESRDALAAFFGGDLIDAALEPNNDNRARAGIYHNGNGYFCDNIVRFLDRLIEIGPDGQKRIQFDEHGMHAFAADGTTIMTITSKPLNYEVVEAVRGSMKNIGTPSTALYSAVSIIHPVTMPNGMIRLGSCTIQGRGSSTVSLANLGVGDQISVPVTLNLGYTITQDLNSYAYSGYFRVRIYKGSGSTLVEAFSQTATISPSTGKGSMQVTATITQAGTYTLEVTFGNAMLATTGGTAATVSGIDTGTITSGVADQIHIGANGMLVVRKGMKFLLNDNYFGVMVGAGFGLQIQDSVMTMKLANTQWQMLSRASDGTLKLG